MKSSPNLVPSKNVLAARPVAHHTWHFVRRDFKIFKGNVVLKISPQTLGWSMGMWLQCIHAQKMSHSCCLQNKYAVVEQLYYRNKKRCRNWWSSHKSVSWSEINARENKKALSAYSNPDRLSSPGPSLPPSWFQQTFWCLAVVFQMSGNKKAVLDISGRRSCC